AELAGEVDLLEVDFLGEAVLYPAKALEQVLEAAHAVPHRVDSCLPLLGPVVDAGVPHGREDRPPGAGVGGERGLRPALVALALREWPRQPPREAVATALDRAAVGRGRARREPERRKRRM